MEIFSRKNRFQGPIRGVILDWSGTAVDFGSFGSIHPFLDVFRESWVEITAEEVREHMGLSYWDHLSALLQSESVSAKWTDIYGAPPSEYDMERLHRNLEQAMPAGIDNHAEPVPGLLETVAEFRGRGLKIGSTCSHSFPAADALAEAARERGYKPDSVVCSTDVPAGRPFPWMCWQNAINLEVYPLKGIVKIGDTVPDILEGLNAGMWTIAILDSSNELGMTKDELDRADRVSLQLDLERIEKKFFATGAHFVVREIGECPAIIDQINERLKLGEEP